MDLYSLEKFKKYKNDWNYPVQVRSQKVINQPKRKKCPSFKSAMKFTLTMGQFFALNPVMGIRNNDVSKFRFKYISWRSAYTYLIMMGQSCMVGSLVISLFTSTGSTVDTASTMIFYSFALVTSILFLRIASKWPSLNMQISNMEVEDPNTDTTLRRNCNISCVLVMVLAAMEHLLSELYGIGIVMDCAADQPVYEYFQMMSFPWIYAIIPYSTYLGIMFHFINIQCTFGWNFADLFVICMSLYLTSRLEQVNQRVVAAKDKNLPSSFWRTMREDYNKATHLVRSVDKIIGGVIFISFASNLFFVCSQLLHTLAGGMKISPRCGNQDTPDRRLFRGYEHSIYFAYSFAFLVFRSLAVSLTAAKVHTASLEPAFALYEVSPTTYCVEIERFLGQIHGNTVALTGLQFFNVKRGLILTIAGTIVTYELVLMQFTGVTPTSPSTT